MPSSALLRRLHAEARRIPIFVADQDNRRNWLQSQFGVRSFKDLSDREALLCWDLLRAHALGDSVTRILVAQPPRLRLPQPPRVAQSPACAGRPPTEGYPHSAEGNPMTAARHSHRRSSASIGGSSRRGLLLTQAKADLILGLAVQCFAPDTRARLAGLVRQLSGGRTADLAHVTLAEAHQLITMLRRSLGLRRPAPDRPARRGRPAGGLHRDRPARRPAPSDVILDFPPADDGSLASRWPKADLEPSP